MAWGLSAEAVHPGIAGPGFGRARAGAGLRRLLPCAAHGALAQGTNIGKVSTTISRAGATISAVSASPRSLDVDAIVIGVIEGADGPRTAPGAEQVAEALGGELTSTLAVLGATGKAEEVTKVPAERA